MRVTWTSLISNMAEIDSAPRFNAVSRDKTSASVRRPLARFSAPSWRVGKAVKNYSVWMGIQWQITFSWHYRNNCQKERYWQQAPCLEKHEINMSRTVYVTNIHSWHKLLIRFTTQAASCTSGKTKQRKTLTYYSIYKLHAQPKQIGKNQGTLLLS